MKNPVQLTTGLTFRSIHVSLDLTQGLLKTLEHTIQSLLSMQLCTVCNQKSPKWTTSNT